MTNVSRHLLIQATTYAVFAVFTSAIALVVINAEMKMAPFVAIIAGSAAAIAVAAIFQFISQYHSETEVKDYD